MMTKPLEFQADALRDREHIHVSDFLTLIAHAKIPLRTGATGIDCIVSFTAPPLWLPVNNEKARTELERLLPTLPHLQYPMSDQAEAAFIRAYILLRNRPRFIPLLLQESDLLLDVEIRKNEVLHLRRQLKMDDSFRLFSKWHEPVASNAPDGYLDTVLAERILRNVGLVEKFNDVLLQHRHEIERIDDSNAAPTVREAGNRFPGILEALRELGRIDDYGEALMVNSRSRALERPVNDHLALAPTVELHPENLEKRWPEIGTAVFDDLSDTSEAKLPHQHAHVDDQNLLAERPNAPIAKRGSKERSTGKSIKSGALLLNADEVGEKVRLSRSSVYNRVNPKMINSYDPDFPKPREYPSGQMWIKSEIEAYVAGKKQKLKKSQPDR
jgi:predicted DNA-binding transcriptional regulator AlpA